MCRVRKSPAGEPCCFPGPPSGRAADRCRHHPGLPGGLSVITHVLVRGGGRGIFETQKTQEGPRGDGGRRPQRLCAPHTWLCRRPRKTLEGRRRHDNLPERKPRLSTQLGSLPLGVKSTATVVFEAQSRVQGDRRGHDSERTGGREASGQTPRAEGGCVRRVTARVGGALREVARAGRVRNSGTGPQRTAAGPSLRTEEGGRRHGSPRALNSGGWASPPPFPAPSPRTPAGHQRGENQPSTPGITRRGLQSPQGAWPVDFRAPRAKGRFSRTSRGERSRCARNNAAAASSTRGGLTAVKTISSPDSCTRPSQDEDAGRHELS